MSLCSQDSVLKISKIDRGYKYLDYLLVQELEQSPKHSEHVLHDWLIPKFCIKRG